MVRIERLVLGPVSAAGRAGRIALEVEAERTIDAALAGPLPEAVARSLVEHRVLERLLWELRESVASSRHEAVDELLEELLRSEEAGRISAAAVKQVTASPAFRAALADLLASPEVRRGLSQGTAGFGSELATALRRRTGAWDDALHRTIRHVLHLRGVDASERGYGGALARAVALVVDAAIVQFAFLLGVASAALVLSLAGLHTSQLTRQVLAGAGWLLVVGVYFVACWSIAGTTPGLRLLALKVTTRDGGAVSVPRAILRFAGLLAAIAVWFLGFVPVLVDRRRRALQDFAAGTVVVARAP